MDSMTIADEGLRQRILNSFEYKRVWERLRLIRREIPDQVDLKFVLEDHKFFEKNPRRRYRIRREGSGEFEPLHLFNQFFPIPKMDLVVTRIGRSPFTMTYALFQFSFNEFAYSGKSTDKQIEELYSLMLKIGHKGPNFFEQLEERAFTACYFGLQKDPNFLIKYGIEQH